MTHRPFPLRSLLVTAGLVATLAPEPGQALVVDPFTSIAQPANALLMPFDATRFSDGRFLVSNVQGISPGGVPAVVTNWSFWSDNGSHLANVLICLTLNDTVVVSPRAVQGIDPTNATVGPMVDLFGFRGILTVTAYATDNSCLLPLMPLKPVDGALVGSFQMKLRSDRVGANAVGLGVDPTGQFTDLPSLSPSPDPTTGFLRLPTSSPKGLAGSRVVLMAVREHSGSGSFAATEIGPLPSLVTANTTFYDEQEVATSLPDVSFSTLLIDTMKRQRVGGLIPKTVEIASPGFLSLTNIQAPGGPVGGNSFVYGLHAHKSRGFLSTSYGAYTLE